MAINKPAIDYANERIRELKQSYEISEIQENDLFYLLIEAHDDAKAGKKLDEFIKSLKPKGIL